MMNEDLEESPVATLTTEIVVAYVGHQDIAIIDIGRLIVDVGQTLRGLGREPEMVPAKPVPAVPVGRSVRQDHLVCLVCGKPFKSLRRHLQTAHELTPAAYREAFGLHRDYPMVAAASTERRAEIARRNGLGQRRLPEPKAVVQPKPVPRVAMKPVRGRRLAKKAEAVPA